ncbi:hypothetical protein ABK040_013395 [Willaertia magna]
MKKKGLKKRTIVNNNEEIKKKGNIKNINSEEKEEPLSLFGKAPFLDDFLKTIQQEKIEKSPFTSSNNTTTKEFITLLLKQQEALEEQQQQLNNREEKDLTSLELLNQRKSYLERLRKRVLPLSNFTNFVKNTLEFFEDNLNYFVKHFLEFQRLIAQLPTKEERQIFLHTIYMYYYVDILLEMRRIKKEEEKQEIKREPLMKRYFDHVKRELNGEKRSKIVLPFVGKVDGSAGNNKSNEEQMTFLVEEVDEKVVAYTTKKFREGFNTNEEIYDLVNNLNSKETLIIERCILNSAYQ